MSDHVDHRSTIASLFFVLSAVLMDDQKGPGSWTARNDSHVIWSYNQSTIVPTYCTPSLCHATVQIRATPLAIWRGCGVFAWQFLFISQGRLKALFCSAQDRLGIFISIFILYLFQPVDKNIYFHHALWPFIYFTHSPQQIFISKKLQPPPRILMVAP